MNKLLLTLVLLPFIGFSQNIKKDFKRINQWFVGEYDNLEQTKSDSKQGRMHVSVVKIDAKQLGKYVFYVKYYKDNDPNKIYRQRINVMNIENNQVQSESFSFKDSTIRDLHLKPELQAKLEKEDLSSSLGCPEIWIKNGEEYIATIDSCKYYSARRKKDILMFGKMMISKNGMATTEAAKDETVKILFGSLDGYALILNRVK